jgi:hypothetical protein
MDHLDSVQCVIHIDSAIEKLRSSIHQLDLATANAQDAYDVKVLRDSIDDIFTIMEALTKNKSFIIANDFLPRFEE